MSRRKRTGINGTLVSAIMITLSVMVLVAISVSALLASPSHERGGTTASVGTSDASQWTETFTASVSTVVSAPAASNTAEPLPEWTPDEAEVKAVAKTLYGECRGVASDMEKAAVVWCILNRVDSPRYPNTVLGVITQPHQFSGYDEDYPVWDSLEAIAVDVLTRWHYEQEGQTDVGRVLPKEYIYFTGDGRRNHFTIEWKGKAHWDWSLPNPYTEDAE